MVWETGSDLAQVHCNRSSTLIADYGDRLTGRSLQRIFTLIADYVGWRQLPLRVLLLFEGFEFAEAREE